MYCITKLGCELWVSVCVSVRVSLIISHYDCHLANLNTAKLDLFAQNSIYFFCSVGLFDIFHSQHFLAFNWPHFPLIIIIIIICSFFDLIEMSRLICSSQERMGSVCVCVCAELGLPIEIGGHFQV